MTGAEDGKGWEELTSMDNQVDFLKKLSQLLKAMEVAKASRMVQDRLQELGCDTGVRSVAEAPAGGRVAQVRRQFSLGIAASLQDTGEEDQATSAECQDDERAADDRVATREANAVQKKEIETVPGAETNADNGLLAANDGNVPCKTEEADSSPSQASEPERSPAAAGELRSTEAAKNATKDFVHDGERKGDTEVQKEAEEGKAGDAEGLATVVEKEEREEQDDRVRKVQRSEKVEKTDTVDSMEKEESGLGARMGEKTFAEDLTADEVPKREISGLISTAAPVEATAKRRKRNSMLLHGAPLIDPKKQRRGTVGSGASMPHGPPAGTSSSESRASPLSVKWKAPSGSRTPLGTRRPTLSKAGSRGTKLRRRAATILETDSRMWDSLVHKGGEAGEDLAPRRMASSEAGSTAKPALKRTRSSVVSSQTVEKDKIGSHSNIPEPVRRYLTLTQDQEAADVVLEREEKDKDKFTFVFLELLRTEQDFVRDLKIINEVFRMPMEAKKMLSPTQALMLFGGLDPILQVNEEFLRQLQCLRVQMTFAEQLRYQKGWLAYSNDTMISLSITFADSKRVRMFNVKLPTTVEEVIQMLVTSELKSKTDEMQQQTKAKYRSWQLTDKATGLALPDHMPVAQALNYQGRKLRADFSKPVSGRDVGECLLKMASYLKIYNEYCSRQMDQVALVDSIRKDSSEVRAFLKKQLRHKRCRNLDLLSFLIMPLQRLCKYPLLIKELEGATPKDHIEYENLAKANRLIADVGVGEAVMGVNNRKKQLDELCFVRDLQNSLDGKKAGFAIAVPGRKFVCQGPCTVHASLKKYERVEAATYFLFTDMVMITSEASNERYRFVSHCMLKDAYVMTIPGDACAMRLVNVDKKSRKSIILSAPSSEEIQVIVEHVQEQILHCTYDHWALSRSQNNKDVLPFDQWNETHGRMLFQTPPPK